MSEAMTTKDQLTAAIESVICDLWDEHPSTNLADRKKIEDAITPQFDDAYVAIAALEAQLEEVSGALREWIRENAPGGWIDNLRKSVSEKDAALQAATQRAEEAEASREKAYEVIRRVGDHVDRMREGEMSYSIVDRVRECRTQRDALQARVGKLEEWVSEALEIQRKHYGNGMMTHMEMGDWSRSVCFDMAKDRAALSSREGGE